MRPCYALRPSPAPSPQAAVRDQKAEGHDLSEKAASAAAAAAAEKAETARLRAQIVESPEARSQALSGFLCPMPAAPARLLPLLTATAGP